MTKRSSTKAERPESVFFIDRNLGNKILPDMLRAAGWAVECHETHFPENANGAEIDDTKWIQFAGQKGWIILSANLGMLSNPVEAKSLMECGTLVFMINQKDKTGPQMAEIFIAAKNHILRKIKNHAPPGIFKISSGDSSLHEWLPKGYASRKNTKYGNPQP